jgi:hypothetical protein
MANDEGLVDELEQLESQKKALETKEEELKRKLVELAKQKNTDVLFGAHKICSIKRYDKIIYPEDKTQLTALLKQKGLWEEFSMINYPRFGSRVANGDLAKELVDLVKKETAFRVVLKEKA